MTDEHIGCVELQAWRGEMQPGELKWHIRRGPFDLVQFSAETWRHFGFAQDAFAGKTLIDLGAGPTFHGAWFSGVKRLIAIDPLADGYRDHCPWHRLGLANEVYVVPAEHRITALVGQADALVSINALDHGYDFALAAANIAAYLRPGGTAFISVDVHDSADVLHQMILTAEFCEGCFAAAELVIERHETGRPHGFGVAHRWFLRKKEIGG